MNNPYGVEAMWNQGDAIIKAVAITLLLMSVASWFVIVVRTWRLSRLRKSEAALQKFWHTHSFEEGLALFGPVKDNPYRNLAEEGEAAVAHHLHHRDDLHGHMPLADWVTACLKGSIDESAERLQRPDRLYDLVIELGYNDSPPRPGAGSAIFMHVARPGLRPTAGSGSPSPLWGEGRVRG